MRSPTITPRVLTILALVAVTAAVHDRRYRQALELRVGDVVKLRCDQIKSNGVKDGQPALRWTKDGRELSAGNERFVFHPKALSIRNTTLEDSGEYWLFVDDESEPLCTFHLRLVRTLPATKVPPNAISHHGSSEHGE